MVAPPLGLQGVVLPMILQAEAETCLQTYVAAAAAHATAPVLPCLQTGGDIVHTGEVTLLTHGGVGLGHSVSGHKRS